MPNVHNLDNFKDFKLKKGATISLKIDFPKGKFKMVKKKSIIGTKRIKIGQELNVYLKTNYRENDI